MSLGLLLAFIGIAQSRWDSGTARVLPEFFAGNQVRLFGINISYHQVIVLITTVAVVIGLRVFLYQTRAGIGQSPSRVAAQTPINLVESGPVGGVIGAAAIGRLLGEENLITLDIGGTTAKASLVEQGAVRLTDDYHIVWGDAIAGKTDPH